MRKHWLLFTQTVTIGIALLFVINTLKPELLSKFGSNGVVTVYQNDTPPPPTNANHGLSLSHAAKQAMPSVVNIFTSSTSRPRGDDPLLRFFFGDQFEAAPQRNSSLGSGVIVSPDGFILTNHHVIESAEQIEVALSDGRKAKARTIGTDPETDLAVIKIDMPNELPAIVFGQPNKMQVGDIVLAIGNPFGVGQTVTMGIVSALKRDQPELSAFESFIQTDAAINPGNSGGALVDMGGNLIGINSAIYSSNGGSLGIGFAIPADTAKNTMKQIIETGSVTRGWIGTGVQELSPELAESFGLQHTKGVLITDIIRDGPAHQAGFMPGDVLVSINNQTTENWNSMLNVIANLKPGKIVNAEIIRNGKSMSLSVTIGVRPRPNSR